MAYWFNVRTGLVEQDPDTSPKEDLMGPYDSEADAQQALRAAADRTLAWDEEDARREDEERREGSGW